MNNSEVQRVGYQQVKTKKMLDILHEFSTTALTEAGHPLVDLSEMWLSFHTSALFEEKLPVLSNNSMKNF